MMKAATILCVDDEPNILRSLRRLFMEDGYTLLNAAGGEEALGLLERHGQVEVILADYRMPGMSGVEFFKKVRETWPDTIRIVLSGYADLGAILAAINEGQIYKFIPKPWNDDELRVTIAKAVEVFTLQQANRHLAQELRQSNAELQRLAAEQEKIIEKRTADLIFRQQALVTSQNILHALPAAVIGVDDNGTVVFTNRCADMLFVPPPGQGFLGAGARESLPGALVHLLSRLGDTRQSIQAEIMLAGRIREVTGIRMTVASQKGMILLINPIQEQLHE